MASSAFARLSLSALALAVAISVAVALDDHLPGELSILKDAQDWPLPSLFSRVVRTLGDVRLVLFLALGLAVFLWRTGATRFAAVVLLTAAILWPYQTLIKEVVDRPRPPAEVLDVRGSATSPSFPSGHVLSPTVVWGLAAFAVVRRQRGGHAAPVLLWGLLIVLAGLVNIHLAVQWPSDVLGGFAWGVALMAAALSLALRAGESGPTRDR